MEVQFLEDSYAPIAYKCTVIRELLLPDIDCFCEGGNGEISDECKSVYKMCAEKSKDVR